MKKIIIMTASISILMSTLLTIYSIKSIDAYKQKVWQEGWEVGHLAGLEYAETK